MIGLTWASFALASTQVVVVDATLTPGRISTIQVAQSPPPSTTKGGGGASAKRPPFVGLDDLRLAGATVLRAEVVRPGVTDLTVVPNRDAAEVVVALENQRWSWPVLSPPVTPLDVPDRVAGTARDEPITFSISATTASTLSPDDVLVRASEGQTVVVAGSSPDALEVRFVPNERSAPRVVPIAIVDLRAPRTPVVVPVALRARPRLTVNAAPGSTVSLSVGRRTYGPVSVPDSGSVVVRVDQYPGESVATVRATDDLGNTTTSDLTLATAAEPMMVATPTGRWLPGQPPPALHVWAWRPSGAPLPSPPTCQTPQIPLDLVDAGEGHWWVELSGLGDGWRDAGQDLRIVCQVDETTQRARVQLTRGVPERIGLQVYPEDLGSDFPLAELRAVVEDTFGDRLDTKGLTVVSDIGEVTVRADGRALRGEYFGGDALAQGVDRVVASYQRPPGPGPTTSLQLGFDTVPGSDGGTWTVHARALNAQDEPVAFTPVKLTVEGERHSLMTQADGWASTTVEARETLEPRVLSAEAGDAVRNALAIPGEPGVGGPSEPDLRVSRTIRVRPGRIAAVMVSVEPKILRAGPGSIANIVVRLKDRSGRPVIDEPIGLEASEGRILPVVARPDGTLVARFVPEPGREERTVVITATTEGDFQSSTEVRIEPRGLRASLGPYVARQTNFGELHSWVVGFDVDVRTRTRLLRDALMLRFGLHGNFTSSLATLTDVTEVDLRSTLTAIDVGAALRDDRGPWGLWIGFGGTLAVEWSDVRFDGRRALLGRRYLGGPMAFAGVSRRAPLGEILFEARGYALQATSAPDIGYVGNLGGVGFGVGYRLVY